MLRPRIIPCLLVRNKGLVKTIQFKDGKYIGDPINAVRIFNEKESDELMVLDIDATAKLSEPDYRMIENLATECRMPLCYGGGIRNLDQAQKIFSLGVEKIAISSAAVKNPALISDIASKVGSQSVVVVVDVKKKLFGGYEMFTDNGKKSTGLNPIDFVRKMENEGAGEIVINSIDNDGVMKGYDLDLIEKIRNNITLPLTVLGGAGGLEHIGQVINKYGIIGAAAGSLFVFKGKYKAVLINYPNFKEKDELINQYFKIL
ncbi:AglZ/HisF2 family acetamidino modification protein [Aquirufa sp. A-Brett2-15D]